MKFYTTKNRVICYQDSEELYLPALVMAHPLGMTQNVWQKLKNSLSGHYRCISWDLPGHGSSGPAFKGETIESVSEDIINLLDFLEIKNYYFIGTSIGGLIGQFLIKEKANNLLGAYLTNTAAKIGDSDAWIKRAEEVRNHGIVSISNSLVSRWFAESFLIKNKDDLEGWQIQLSRQDADSYAILCEAIAHFDYQDQKYAYNRSVVLLAGCNDVSIPLEQMINLQQQFLCSEYHQFSDVGHIIPLEKEDELSKILLHKTNSEEKISEQGVAFSQGLEVRKSVLGDVHVTNALTRSNEFDLPFQQFITRVAWGELWGNSDLRRKERSLITMAILAVLGRDGELSLHIRTCTKLGVTKNELRQVLMHVAIYGGIPAANHAFELVKKELE